MATGGMGQVVAALPQALVSAYASRYDVAIVCPLYEPVKRRYSGELTFLGATTAKLAWRDQYVGVYSATRDGVMYYFVDNLQYFGRERAYGYFDDGERFAFFCKAVFSVIEFTGFHPDVIHAHDWQSALVPLYLRTRFADKYSGIRSVLTIHNLEYQGQFAPHTLSDVFDLYESERSLVDWNGCVNLLKGAIVTCDRLTTVSPSYAQEIREYGGHGLEPILRENAYKLTGIINGIDTELYDPATDKALYRNYSADSPSEKFSNKRKLRDMFGLRQNPQTPVICVVSRLVAHKGIDLITQIAEDLAEMDLQFVLLGTGDHYFETYFRAWAAEHPGKVGINISYSTETASLIFAGSDITLMPSLSEPCGLTQMISCRYGTIPIVRETGGLKDTIRDCRLGDGNGFLFPHYNAAELLYTIRKALELYSAPDTWSKLTQEAMRSDFSWKSSADAYAAIYEELL
jgi:starch synthase